MKIISVVSAKGGVGKTTVCSNLSAALAFEGCNVLCIDLDPQNALRYHMGLDPSAIEGCSRATLAGVSFHEICVEARSGVRLIPYGSVTEEDRVEFEKILESWPLWLRENLQSMALPPDTLVVVDTPPGPSVYLRQALRAADLTLVATLSDAASYATLPMIETLIHRYCVGRPGFIDYAYVINQVNRSRQLSRDVTDVMRDHLGERVIALIHQDQAVSEALACSQSVLEYDANSQGTLDFVETARWVIEKLSIAGYGDGQERR